MKINTEESSLEQYAIISYSHADSETVAFELEEFDKHCVCYWDDKQMTGGMGYDTQFLEILDKENCKGIIFFISSSFLLSEPCVKEMKEFRNKYGVENRNKFCLFVLPKDYPRNDEDKILEKISQYVEENKNNAKIQERAKKIEEIKENIKLFLELNRNGKVNCARVGNSENYIDSYCKDGLFHRAGITFGHMGERNKNFGNFPQKQAERGASDGVPRKFDKKLVSYLPIEWLVIKENKQMLTLLSKNLLFAVDYLGLKYPFKKNNKTPQEQIKDIFYEYFDPYEDKSKFIKNSNIRFLSEAELKFLLRHNQEDLDRKREILLPKATFFAQTSNIKNAPAFWLAGDINDAQWVDAATESLSEQKVGTELYYVRIVVDIEKTHTGEK